MKFYRLQPALDEASGIVYAASVNGKPFVHDRALCGPADILFGMGLAAAFMGAEGMNGLSGKVIGLQKGVHRQNNFRPLWNKMLLILPFFCSPFCHSFRNYIYKSLFTYFGIFFNILQSAIIRKATLSFSLCLL